MGIKICIVGNAKLLHDYSGLIDSSDIVIRINSCNNLGAFGGKKTDYLFLNNTGPAARQFIDNQSLQKGEVFKKSKVFFARNLECHIEYLKKFGKSKLEKTLLVDYTEEIVAAYKIDPKKVEVLSYDFNNYVFEKITGFSLIALGKYIFLDRQIRCHLSPKKILKKFIYKRRFLMPSTGMFAILYALNKIAKDSEELHLIGFTFEGWNGHEWATERALCLELAKVGKLKLYDL